MFFLFCLVLFCLFVIIVDKTLLRILKNAVATPAQELSKTIINVVIAIVVVICICILIHSLIGEYDNAQQYRLLYKSDLQN